MHASTLGNFMRPYDASAGIKNIELSITAKYSLSEHWAIGAHAGLSQLVGSAANSPLTQQKFQPTLAAVVIYRF
jgi:MipA family protein